MNTWPKRCTMCSREYYPGEWGCLPFVGHMPIDEIERLDLRNCECGTTLAIDVEPTGLTWVIARDLSEVLRNDAREFDGYPPPYKWPPPPRRQPTDTEAAEAQRLNEIANDLDARVNEWNERDRQEDAA